MHIYYPVIKKGDVFYYLVADKKTIALSAEKEAMDCALKHEGDDLCSHWEHRSDFTEEYLSELKSLIGRAKLAPGIQ